MDGSWICRGGYRAPLAFPMSAFARWFAVHPVQAFVWLHAHIEPMSMPACSSAVAASPAGAPPRVLGGFAGSGCRFRHGSLDFCAVFGGGCSPSAQPTWGNAGILWRFGLIRPAKPLRSRKRGLRVAREARRLLQGTPVAKTGIRA